MPQKTSAYTKIYDKTVEIHSLEMNLSEIKQSEIPPRKRNKVIVVN